MARVKRYAWAGRAATGALDRPCLDDEAPLRCEVERIRAALGTVAALYS